MFIWSARKLADQLKAGQVSEVHKLYYLLMSCALCLLDYIAGFLSLGTGTPSQALSSFDIAMRWLLLLRWFPAIIISFLVNQKGDNREFLDRLVCLSVPVWFKSTVFAIAGFLVFILLGVLTIGNEFRYWIDDQIVSYFSSASFLLLFTALMAHYMNYVSKANKPNSALKPTPPTVGGAA